MDFPNIQFSTKKNDFSKLVNNQFLLLNKKTTYWYFNIFKTFSLFEE